MSWLRRVALVAASSAALISTQPVDAGALEAPPECGETCYSCRVSASGNYWTCCEWVGGAFVGCTTTPR